MKNNLRALEGKTIRLIDTEGDQYVGKVGDYIFPEDNEPEGIEGIIIDCPERNGVKTDHLIEFKAYEIVDVEVL